MAQLIKPCTMKKLIKPINLVLPETARYIYPGRVISGELDKPEKYQFGSKRVVSGRCAVSFTGASHAGFAR
jgi:hypothetical protein